MIVIRGRIEPQRAAKTRGVFRTIFGRGRWNLDYIVKDSHGSRIGGGSFKARRDGCFALSLDTAAPAAVEIRLRGVNGCGSDCCRIAVHTDNDIINLPRKLSPS